MRGVCGRAWASPPSVGAGARAAAHARAQNVPDFGEILMSRVMRCHQIQLLKCEIVTDDNGEPLCRSAGLSAAVFRT